MKPVPPLEWTDQPIAIYHGPVELYVGSVLHGVNLRYGDRKSDFGPGFYTTTVFDQAKKWALAKSARSGSKPAVVEFVVPRNALAQLETLCFVRANSDADDFWSFVFHCRTGGLGHGRTGENPSYYDVVCGPVTAIWRKRKVKFDADQISFHTARGAALVSQSQARQVY